MGWEELTSTLAREIAEGTRPAGALLPSVRALALADGCAPGTAARALGELRRAGVATGGQRRVSRVAADGARRARLLLGARVPLRLAGSDDPALDLVLRAAGDAIEPADVPRGSLHGLAALARGEVDAAALHLRHGGEAAWNDPFVRRLLGDEPVLLVHLWWREQGLVAGAPLRGARDLDGRRVAARPVGTGTHLLLERLLGEAGAAPAATVPASSHLGVAAAVAGGAADAGLAVRAAAELTGLPFTPLALEPFELAVRERALPALEPLLAALAEPGLRAEVEALGGYETAHLGQVRRAA